MYRYTVNGYILVVGTVPKRLTKVFAIMLNKSVFLLGVSFYRYYFFNSMVVSNFRLQG
jgi:hypothetical protein